MISPRDGRSNHTAALSGAADRGVCSNASPDGRPDAAVQLDGPATGSSRESGRLDQSAASDPGSTGEGAAVTLTCIFQCRILAHGKNVFRKINWIATHLHADAADPWEYECRRCHQTWGDAVLTDPHQVACSNCYSDNIVLVKLRLAFQNWGEHNGGVKEQRSRWTSALQHQGAEP